MVMTVLKKAVAILLLLLFLLASDMVILYGVNVKMREALNNSVDSAVMVNLDNASLRYTDMDSLRLWAENAFRDTLRKELGLNSDYHNNTFFRHGVEIEDLQIDWKDDYPLVRAQISARVDTALLGRFVTDYSKVMLNNFDHLYWQWA